VGLLTPLRGVSQHFQISMAPKRKSDSDDPLAKRSKAAVRSQSLDTCAKRSTRDLSSSLLWRHSDTISRREQHVEGEMTSLPVIFDVLRSNRLRLLEVFDRLNLLVCTLYYNKHSLNTPDHKGCQFPWLLDCRMVYCNLEEPVLAPAWKDVTGSTRFSAQNCS
jgi:hypothetical protein